MLLILCTNYQASHTFNTGDCFYNQAQEQQNASKPHIHLTVCSAHFNDLKM